MNPDKPEIETVAFDNNTPVPSVGFNYDAIDGIYDLSTPATDSLLDGFRKAFEWIADVRPGDFKGIAIRVQTVRCVLLQMSEVKAAAEIGVTKQAISQRMSDLRDHFGIRNPTTNLRSDETREKFSELCRQRHQRRKTSSNSGASPTISTTNTGMPSSLPERPQRAVLPLSKQLYAQALT